MSPNLVGRAASQRSQVLRAATVGATRVCAATWLYVIVASLSCGGSSDGPTAPGGGSGGNTAGGNAPPPGPQISPVLGNDVAPAAVTVIVAMVSAGDSVAAPQGVAPRPLGIAVDTGAVPVLAVNAQGQPMAAGVATLGSATGNRVTLDATSTAVVLARTLAPPASVPLPDEATLRQLISQRSEFSGLVDSVRATMARGASYATSRTVVTLAATLSAAVINGLPANASGDVMAPARPPRSSLLSHATRTVTVTPHAPAFTVYPVAITSSGGTLTFANASYLTFDLRVAPQPGTDDTLGGKTLCPLCIPPSFAVLPVTATYAAPPATGAMSAATVSFGAARRAETLKQGALDVMAGIFRFAGVVAPEDALRPLVGTVGTALDFQAAAIQANWHDAMAAVISGLVAAAPDIGMALLQQAPRFAGRAGLFGFLRALAAPLAVLDNASWLMDRGYRYSAAITYWNTAPEQVQYCIATGGTLSTACVTAVQVKFAASSVSVGQTVQATAIATDAVGDTVAGLPVQWAVASGAAVVSQSGLVSLTGPGTTTITATVGGSSGTANLSVQGVASDTSAVTGSLSFSTTVAHPGTDIVVTYVLRNPTGLPALVGNGYPVADIGMLIDPASITPSTYGETNFGCTGYAATYTDSIGTSHVHTQVTGSCTIHIFSAAERPVGFGVYNVDWTYAGSSAQHWLYGAISISP